MKCIYDCFWIANDKQIIGTFINHQMDDSYINIKSLQGDTLILSNLFLISFATDLSYLFIYSFSNYSKQQRKMNCRSILELLLVFFVYLSLTQSGMITSPFTEIITGRALIITSFNSSNPNQVATVNISYNQAVGAYGKGYQNAGLALITFQGIISTQFSFNTTIVSYNYTNMQISAIPLGNSFFDLLAMHYIVTDFKQIQILNGCFFCNNLITGNGTRSQSFSILQTNYTNPSSLTVTSAIRGIMINNTLGVRHKMSISASYPSNGSSTLNTVITVYQYNVLSWVCLTVINYNGKNRLIYGPNKLAMASFWASTTITNNTLLSNLQLPYNSIFMYANTMFFGLSGFSISMTASTVRSFILKSDNFLDITVGFSTSSAIEQLTLSQFFIVYMQCTTPSEGFNTSTYKCQPCTFLITNNYSECSTCSKNCLACSTVAANCTTCSSALYLNLTTTNNTCICMNGYFMMNFTCMPCSAYLFQCSSCSGSTTCTLCKSGYVLSGANTCRCSSTSYLVNGSCVSIMGCLTMNNITSGGYCVQCYTAGNYISTLNQTCMCISHTQYDATSGNCTGICGDGYSFGNVCDDGDVIDNNGCSNSCTVNPGYYCSNPQDGGKSICVLTANLQIQYQYAQKIFNTNNVILYFTVQPPQSTLALMNFTNLIQTTIPTNIAQITTTYDYSSSTLTINIPYTSSIEGTLQNVTVLLDPTQLYSQPINVQMTPVGCNYRLTYDSLSQFNSIALLVAQICGGLALLISLISSVAGYKMIGVELILPIQFVYFAMVCFKFPMSIIASFKGFAFANGYNKVIAWNLAQRYHMSSGLVIAEIQKEFVLNFNFMSALLGFVSILVLILYAIYSCCSHDQVNKRHQEEVMNEKQKEKIILSNKKSKTIESEEKALIKTQQKQKKLVTDKQLGQSLKQPNNAADKLFKCIMLIVDRLLIFLFIATMSLITFAFGIQIIDEKPSTTFTTIQNNTSLALFCFMMMSAGLMYSLNAILYYYDVHSKNVAKLEAKSLKQLKNKALLVKEDDKITQKQLEAQQDLPKQIPKIKEIDLEKENQQELNISFRTNSKYYPILLTSIYLLQITLLSTLFYSSFCIYLITALTIVPLVLVFKAKPYDQYLSVDFIGCFLTQLIPVLMMVCMLVVNWTNNTSEMINVIAVFAVVGFVFLVEVFNVIRLIRNLQCCKLFQKNTNNKKKKNFKLEDHEHPEKEFQEIAKKSIKDNLLINTTLGNNKMIDWEARNHEEYNSIQSQRKLKDSYESQRKIKDSFESQNKKKGEKQSEKDQNSSNSNEDEEEEDDELIKLKKRLKMELKNKRGSI